MTRKLTFIMLYFQLNLLQRFSTHQFCRTVETVIAVFAQTHHGCYSVTRTTSNIITVRFPVEHVSNYLRYFKIHNHKYHKS